MAIPRIRQMLEEAYAVEMEDAKSVGALGFMHRSLAQVTLPHSAQQGTYFERTNGRLTLSIVSSTKYGLPYGSVPRILLSWICSEAVRTNSPQLMLGYCQKDFLERLNLHTGGSYIAALKKQTLALFRSMFSVDYAEASTGEGFENLLLARKGFVFWNDKHPEQRSLWESYLMLDQAFFDSILEAPVPVDLRVLHALRKSPLAMDIYTWLVYRVFVLRHSNKLLVHIPWPALMLQFGAGYSAEPRPSESEADFLKRSVKAVHNFKGNFMRQMRKVLVFYPEARDAISATSRHLILKPCRLHIRYTGSAKIVPLD